MTDSQRRQGLPLVISELKQQSESTRAEAVRHEANAEAEMQKARTKQLNADAYDTLANSLQKELDGLSPHLPQKPAKADSGGGKSKWEQLTYSLLKQYPEGLTSAQIRQKLGEQGHEIKRTYMSYVLSTSLLFEKTVLGPNNYIWKFRDPANASENGSQPSTLMDTAPLQPASDQEEGVTEVPEAGNPENGLLSAY